MGKLQISLYGVLQAIEEAVKGVALNWKQKTLSLGSDDASVMVGIIIVRCMLFLKDRSLTC